MKNLYYYANKERILKKAKERYASLSDEEIQARRDYQKKKRKVKKLHKDKNLNWLLNEYNECKNLILALA